MKKLLKEQGAKISFSINDALEKDGIKSALKTGVFLVLFFLLFLFLISSIKAQSIDIVATLPSVCGDGVAEFDEQCDGADMRSRSCVTFGFATGTPSCSSCSFNLNNCVTDAEVFSERTFTFSEGGNEVINNANGTQVIFDFPENFYTTDITLHFFSYENNFFELTKPAPSGKHFIGRVYDFRLYNFFGEEITTLLEQVTVSIDYLGSEISGLNKDSLAPYRFDEVGNSWQEIPGSLLNKTNKRVTFSTHLFSSFAIFASESPPPPPPPPSPGGSGGGFVAPPPTGAVFSGKAYPGSEVMILRDSQVVATTRAGSDASFEVSVTGLSAGNYIFSLYSEDKKGIRSSPTTFPVSLASGSTVSASGIFLSPTVEVDKREVRRGDPITIFGQSAPGADILITVSSEKEIFAETRSDNEGIYLYRLNTAFLEMGDHSAKSKASLDQQLLSPYSRSVSFVVGTTNIDKEIEICASYSIGDINSDCRVNLIDFSIMAFWYRQTVPPAPMHIDLNDDGIIDLRDFSIMAFYWTG